MFVCSVVMCSVVCSEEMSAWSFVCVVRCGCRDRFQIPDPVQAGKMKLKRCFTTFLWKMINFWWFSVSVYIHQSFLGYIWPILGMYRIWFSGFLEKHRECDDSTRFTRHSTWGWRESSTKTPCANWPNTRLRFVLPHLTIWFAEALALVIGWAKLSRNN